MKAFIQNKHRVVFYGTWIILGLIQARFTELQDDEAYYWVYSKFFDWGYVDHPPMTGLLIKMGYAIFPNELGVRLFPLLLNVLSLMIMEKLTAKKDPFLFYAIALSIAVLQISGFVAVPDIPLIFFTALFFLLYQKFIERSNIVNTVLLGLCIALLLYSKYHAVLIVFFTLISNLKLLSKYQAWLAVLIALLLFTPHLWWQYEHNWISFRYHLFESNVNPYKISHTTDFLMGQLLLPGPIAGFILLPAAFLYRPTSTTEKALKVTMAGIYIFFLLSSFRGKVEGNWTSPAMVPLVVLAHQYLLGSIKWRQWLYRLLPATLVLVMFARILMITDILPVKAVKQRYHSWHEWPQKMREKTQGLPIVFSNSYQRASKYWFYSGQVTFSQNWYVNGRNNYNFWPIEETMLGKPYYFLDVYDMGRFTDSLKTPIGWVGYRYDSSLASFAKVNVKVTDRNLRIKTGQRLSIHCEYQFPKLYSDFIGEHPALADTVRIGFFNKTGWVKEVPVPINLHEMNRLKASIVEIDPALPKGRYFFRFTIKVGKNNSTHNSDKINLIVE